ncbi:hypothetical protein GGR58DRAFT_517739 [Xylaria digitata]|nr:hypothetical protein GGR58DRAFT_517739 [Xylaria digitata]
MNLKPPCSRMGARGLRKVKSGCQTCKIRHKKCDESRPACFQCHSTGRQCDFVLLAQPSRNALGGEDDPQDGPSLARPMSRPLRHFANSSEVVSQLESVQFEFFRLVCAPEYAVLFEMGSWESLVLQYAITEPCVYHAALAISALTWNHYSPISHWYDPATGAKSVVEYATIQYNLAICRLNAQLDSFILDRDTTKLTVLSAILFMNIEFLRREQESCFSESPISTHLQGAIRLLRDFRFRFGLRPDSVSQCLEIGLSCIERQAKQLEGNNI